MSPEEARIVWSVFAALCIALLVEIVLVLAAVKNDKEYFLQEAGGDPDKAREIRSQLGKLEK